MKKKKVASLDLKTGEILDGVLVYHSAKHNPYSKGWIMNSQEAIRLFATDKDLKGETHRVLWYLISKLNFENWIYITQKEIAEELEMKKQNVSRAILLLESKGIILRSKKLGRSYAFRLNPNFGWKGKVKNLDEYREEKNKEEAKELKNKINKERNLTLKILSEQYKIPLNKIEKFLAENTET